MKFSTHQACGFFSTTIKGALGPFFWENAYLIFVTGFGSPLMLVLVTMVAMMVMVHYLRF